MYGDAAWPATTCWSSPSSTARDGRHSLRRAISRESGSNTKDPASVSPPVKLLLDRSVAVNRLQKAAENISRALGDRLDRHLLAPVQPADLRPVLHCDHIPVFCHIS
jgi:hypothetical protein